MKTLRNSDVASALLLAGFKSLDRCSNLLILDQESLITPAFMFSVRRRNSAVRIGGGVGLYFSEFEGDWLKKKGLRTRSRCSLPLVMHVANFLELIECGLLRYSNSMDEISRHAASIYQLCSRLPRSLDEFHATVAEGQILTKRFSDFLHIFDYYENDDPLFLKSVAFIEWMESEYPSVARAMIATLTEEQVARLQTFWGSSN